MRRAGAVDIGGTSTKIGIVDEEGRVVSRATVPTSAAGNPLPMLDAAIAASDQPLGIGVSVAGFLDRERAAMVENANLLALCWFPLRRAFEERFPLECRLEVDSNATVAAEYRYGACRGSKRLL